MSAACPSAGRLDHRRRPGRPEHRDDELRVDLALADVVVPVGAGVEGVPGVVGVDQVDPAGDRLDPVDDAEQLLAAGVGVAGVEAEAGARTRRSRPTAGPARRSAGRRRCRRRPCSRSGSAAGSRRSPRRTRRSCASCRSRRPGRRPCRRVHRGRSGPWRRASAAACGVLQQQLAARDPDAVVGGGHVEPVRRVDVDVDARRRAARRRPAAASARRSSAGRSGRTGRPRPRGPRPRPAGRPSRRGHRYACRASLRRRSDHAAARRGPTGDRPSLPGPVGQSSPGRRLPYPARVALSDAASRVRPLRPTARDLGPMAPGRASGALAVLLVVGRRWWSGAGADASPSPRPGPDDHVHRHRCRRRSSASVGPSVRAPDRQDGTRIVLANFTGSTRRSTSVGNDRGRAGRRLGASGQAQGGPAHLRMSPQCLVTFDIRRPSSPWSPVRCRPPSSADAPPARGPTRTRTGRPVHVPRLRLARPVPGWSPPGDSSVRADRAGPPIAASARTCARARPSATVRPERPTASRRPAGRSELGDPRDPKGERGCWR